MLRTIAIAAAFVALLAAAPAIAQDAPGTVPPALCACEVDDRPEPALCPKHYLPFISR